MTPDGEASSSKYHCGLSVGSCTGAMNTSRTSLWNRGGGGGAGVVWIQALTSGKGIYPPSHLPAVSPTGLRPARHTETGQGGLHERGRQEHTTLSTANHWHH
jgi:hypothetical protein